jgi:hypothetical protein
MNHSTPLTLLASTAAAPLGGEGGEGRRQMRSSVLLARRAHPFVELTASATS